MALPTLVTLSDFATTDRQIISIVEGLYGEKPGNDLLETYKAFVAASDIPTFTQALVDAHPSAADSAALAATTAANFGVTTATTSAANVTLAIDFLIAQFASKGIAETVKKVALNWSRPDTDPVNAIWKDAADAFKATTLASLEYSTDTDNTDPETGGNIGDTFTLTTGIDAIVGTAGNDTINALTGTWTALDTIDGGAGADLLSIVQTGALANPLSATVVNVESLVATSTAGVTLDTSAFTGLTTETVVATGGLTLTSAATTDVTATDVAQAANNSTSNGGNNVSISATGVTTGTTTIGATTASAGTTTLSSTVSTGTQGLIAVTGGTTVSVTTATSNAVNTTATQAGITVTGDANTTTVSVTQANAATAAAAVVGVVNGAVSVLDANRAHATDAGVITDVTLSGFAAATVNSGALTTLNLSGTGTSVDLDALGALTTAASSALAINVNGLTLTGELGVDADITTINLDSSTAASTIANLDSNTDTLTALNITGDAALTITQDDAAAAAVYTSTNTGGVTITEALAAGQQFVGTASSGNDSINIATASTKAHTTGAGDDTVTVGGAFSTTASLVGSADAGEGTDTLRGTSANMNTISTTAAQVAAVSNFERVAVLDALAHAIDMTAVGGTRLSLEVGATSAGTITMASGDTIAYDQLAEVTAAVTSGAIIASVTGASGAGASTDVVNLEMNADFDGLAADTFTADLSVDFVETLNIQGRNTDSNATATNHAGQNFVASIEDGDRLSTITVDTDVLMTVSEDTTNFVALNTFNASASTAGVTVVLSNATQGVTATGGSGVDSLTGSAFADVIVGGAGVDTLVGAAGADTITGGEGADIITGGAGSDSIILTETTAAADDVILDQTTGLDTITGFATGDELHNSAAGTEIGTATSGAEVTETAAFATKALATDTTNILTFNASTTSALASTGTETIADFTDVSAGGDVMAYLDEVYSTVSAGEAVVILNDGTDSYVYYYLNDADTDFDAGDTLTLIGQVDAHVIVAADVSIA